MKQIFIYIAFAVLLVQQSVAQNITLDFCREKARANYPLLKQYDLIDKTAVFNISNANKAYLPQFSVGIKASYQSDVTEIPESLGQVISQMSGQPFSFPSMSKDQYQAVAEMNQLIWDGGITSAQKKSIKASAEADKQKTEADIYALNERVNNLFFGIMLIKEQLGQVKMLQDELKENIKKMEAYLQNGLAQPSDLDAVKVELLNANQKETDLKSILRTYMMILSAFTGEKIDETSIFVKPVLPETQLEAENKRPELLYLAAQTKVLDSQKSTLNAANMPRIGIFAQGGYGRPGLNMFDAEFSPFFIGGLRFSWNLSGFYSQKNNFQKIETAKKSIEVQKETFLFNNKLANIQTFNEIEKLKNTLKTDDEIIQLRSNIKKASEAKVANGTMTVTDLLRDINNENQARQNRSLHEIQLYMTVYQLKNNSNN